MVLQANQMEWWKCVIIGDPEIDTQKVRRSAVPAPYWAQALYGTPSTLLSVVPDGWPLLQQSRARLAVPVVLCRVCRGSLCVPTTLAQSHAHSLHAGRAREL